MNQSEYVKNLARYILGCFGLRNSGSGHYVSHPALKPEKPSLRVNNGNICCLKS